MTVALSKLNFRDLGGLATHDGHQLRHHILYRCEGPASFAEEHRRELVELGLRLICDLRADVERKAAPNDWNKSARLLNLDVTNDLRTETNEGWSALREDPSEAGARKAMRLNYEAIPGALHRHMAGLVDAIIAGETPVLVHCTAGKDRTGVLVALLLKHLGVPHETVVADFLRSDVFAKNMRLGGSISRAFQETFGFVPSEATIDAMIGVDADFLEAAFAALTQQWGTTDAYFESAGIDKARWERFRAAVLTPVHS